MVTVWDHLAWEAAMSGSPYRLRFELSPGDLPGDAIPYAPMFLRALDRARALFEATFLDSSKVIAVVGAWPRPGAHSLGHDRDGKRHKDGFETLQGMGLPRLQLEAEWRGKPFCNAVRNRQVWSHRAFEVTGDTLSRDIMLWSNLAQELGIRPKAPVNVTFVDPSRKILLHAYDDRGMDVIAADKATLQPLRREYDHWILGYDRPRIDEVFGALAA